MMNLFSIRFLTGVASLGFVSSACALEPLVDSSKDLLEEQVSWKLRRLDENKDGKIQANEDERLWKRSARYDRDKDGGLDAEELKSIPAPVIDSPGKKLLNVLFKKVGKKGVYLDFYYPDVDAGLKKPVVLFTHGGGWAAGDKSKAALGSFKTVHRALLEEGFCVASVGYRKVNKGGETAMRDCVIDCKDALRFLSSYSETLGIDPKRMFTFGDSAGGHLAQMALWSSSETLKGDEELSEFAYQTVAGVSWYGPCDFQDIQLFNHDDSEGFRDRFGARIMGAGAKAEDKERLYREMSPVSYLSKDSAPLLMIQGDRDTTIPVKQAYRMREALKEVPAPVEILIVKNAGHNWRKVGAEIEPSREEIVARTIEFFRKHR